MDVITQAVNELRHTAALIHASHTIEGKWADEEGKAEHDRLLSLADALARQPQERGEAVAWGVADKDDGFIWTVAESKQQAERNAEQTGDDVIPLYAHPPADDARVAEMESQLAAKSTALVDAMTYTDQLHQRIADLEAQIAEAKKLHDEEYSRMNAAVRKWADRANAAEAQLTASREREGRMRELLTELFNKTKFAVDDMGGMYFVDGELRNKVIAALAAEKGEKE